MVEFIFSTPQASFINFLIIVLFFYAAIRLLFLWISFSTESKKLKLLSEESEKLESLDLYMVKLLGVCHGKGTLYKRLFEISKIYEKSRSVPLEIFEHINVTHRFEESESVKRISGILILLGLLGTVIGLSFSIVDIKKAFAGFAGGELDKLIRTITDFMGNMETAFSTTMVGMGTTLILLLLLFFIDRRRDKLEGKYSTLMVSHVLPLLNVNDREESINEMTQSIRENSSLLKSLVENTVIASSEARAQYHLLVNAIAAMTKSLTSIREPFEEGNKIQGQILGIAADFKSGITELRDSTQSVSKSISDFIGSSTITNSLLSKTVEQLQISQKVETDLHAQVTLTNTNMSTMINNWSEWLNDLRVSVESIKDLSLSFGTVAETSIKTVREEFSSSQKKMDASVTQLIKSMIENRDSISKVYSLEVQEMISAVKTSLENYIDKTDKSAIAERKVESEKFMLTISDIYTHISQVLNKLADYQKEVNESIKATYQNEASGLVEIVKSETSKNNERLSLASDGLEKTLIKLHKDVIEISNELKEKFEPLLIQSDTFSYGKINYNKSHQDLVNETPKNQNNPQISNTEIKTTTSLPKETIESISIADDEKKDNSKSMFSKFVRRFMTK
jgi:hypothetical protein